MTVHDLVEMLRDIDEELEGAEHYARVAYSLRQTHKNAADTFLNMAQQELAHAENIRSIAIAHQEQYDSPETAEKAKVMWDFENERYMKKKKEVMVLMDIARS